MNAKPNLTLTLRKGFISAAGFGVVLALVKVSSLLLAGQEIKTMEGRPDPDPPASSLTRPSWPESGADTPGDGATAARAIRFPSGHSVEVTFRTYQPPTIAVLDIADEYAKLKLQAETGDLAAALALEQNLRVCQFAFTTGSELESELDRLYQTHTLQSPGSIAPGGVSGGDAGIAVVADQLRWSHDYCQRITDEQKQEADHWLAVAASLGDLYAKVRVASKSEDMEEKMRLFGAAWRLGSVNGLGSYAGVLQESQNESSDAAINAYAHLYLYGKLSEASFTGTGPLSRRLQAELEESVVYAGLRLNPWEQEEAQRLAEELLVSNPDCCLD